MIKRITTIELYQEFIFRLIYGSNYKNPMLTTEEQIKHNLLNVLTKEDHDSFCVFKKDKIIGLFVLLNIKTEKYAEMIVGLSEDMDAYDELMDYLCQYYRGYNIDFVYHPKNEILHQKLKIMGACFEREQQKMILVNYQEYDRKHNVIVYEEKYKDQYLSIHNDQDNYWVGNKVIEAFHQFRVILCIMDGKVVGYVDITHSYEENEPYDVFVVPEYRNQGIATEMMSLAIVLNGSKKMSLLVDISNKPAIRVYEKLGFVKTDENSITAHLNILEK